MTKPLAYTIVIEKSPAPADIEFIKDGLFNFNRKYAPEDNYQSLTLFLRAADQTLVGGLLGEIYWS